MAFKSQPRPAQRSKPCGRMSRQKRKFVQNGVYLIRDEINAPIHALEASYGCKRMFKFNMVSLLHIVVSKFFAKWLKATAAFRKTFSPYGNSVLHATDERENGEQNAQALSEGSLNRQQPSLTRKAAYITNFAPRSFLCLATAQTVHFRDVMFA